MSSLRALLTALCLAPLAVNAAAPGFTALRALPAQRVASKPYLNMPETAQGQMPFRLSQTGAFQDLRTLQPTAAAVPYDLVEPFWSDGATKQRFVIIAGQVGFSPTGEWTFAPGTVFVKTFGLTTDARNPQLAHRLETRLLVVDRTGGVYGVVYRWRKDLSDADLLDSSRTESVAVRTANGQRRNQSWYFPSREDRLTCHTARAGGVLGVKTRQLNRDVVGADGTAQNQRLAWNRLGLLSEEFNAAQVHGYPTLTRSDDPSGTLAERARSYLDANCSQCHRPGGTVANFDARYNTPLEQQSLVEGVVLIDEGIDRARVIAPHDPWRSIALARIDTNSDIRMPPLARLTVDQKGVALIREWIDSMPGRPVLAPPVMSPAGGHFRGAVTVTLAAEQGAQVHYTLDGSAPGAQDPVYESPIKVTGPTVVRARAFRDGYTRSIAVQQTFTFD